MVLNISHGRDRPMCPQSRKFRVGSSRGSSRDAVLENRVRVYRDLKLLKSLKLLENTSKLEFSSFFIDYRLQLEHRGRTDESISENFEFE